MLVTFCNTAFLKSIGLSRLPLLGEEPNQHKNFLFPWQNCGKINNLQKYLTELSNTNVLKDGNSFTVTQLVTEQFVCLCITSLKPGKMEPDGNIDEAFVVHGCSLVNIIATCKCLGNLNEN